MSSDWSNSVNERNEGNLGAKRRNIDNNNGRGGKAVTRAEFTQLQENIRVVMERLEVRDRRSQGGSSHRRRSSDESKASTVRSKRRGDRDERKKGLENIKLKIPAFTRSSKPEEFLDWVP